MSRLVIRAIGNSQGVIIPRATLRAWGLGAGDSLELDARGIRPSGRRSQSHEALDALKRRLAAAITSEFTAKQIRAQSLANLHRWKTAGVWVSAYDEWLKILQDGSDGELYATMLGDDERANRLRQSPPYVGLLPREEVHRLNAEAST